MYIDEHRYTDQECNEHVEPSFREADSLAGSVPAWAKRMMADLSGAAFNDSRPQALRQSLPGAA
jgi:hypothetical protein